MHSPQSQNTHTAAHAPDPVSPGRLVLRLSLFMLAASTLLGVAFGNELVRLNDDLLPIDRSATTDARITPDGTQVVYLADELSDGVPEIFLAQIGGGSTPVKLNAPVAATADIVEFQLTSDGTRVLYLVNNHDGGVTANDLYSVPVDQTTAPIRIGQSLVGSSRWQITPDGTRALFTADPDGDGVYNLLSVPVAGGTPTAIHGPLDFTGDFDVDANTARVVSVTRVDGSSAWELYCAPQDGSGSPIKISQTGPGQVLEVETHSGLAFYLQGTGLFRAHADGSPAAVQLSGSMTSGGAVQDFAVSPDGSRVVYRADQDTNEVFELYGVPSDGSATEVKLNGTLIAGGDVDEHYTISPDGTRAIYRADQDTDGTEELYSSPVAGGSNVKLNDTITGSGQVRSEYVVTASTDVVVYAAGQTLSADRELFAVPIDGSAAPTKIAPADGGSGDVWRIFAATSDGTQAFFAADHTTDSRTDLYSVPVDDSADPTRLSQVTVEFGTIESLALTPDDTTAVYRSDESVRDAVKVYSVPGDGSATATRLNQDAVLTPSGSLGSVVASPDGTRAVFRAIQETEDTFDLYGVPVDGSLPTVRLNDALPSGRRVDNHRISPQSAWVVFRADPTTDSDYELFAAPIDGSRGAVKLSASAVNVASDFTITSDDQTVVYRADGELFAVPIDGSEVPTKLSGVMPVTGAVFALQLSADDESCVYQADQSTDGVVEIYVVPVDASTSPVRLNDPFSGQADVRADFQIDATSTWVVYRADRDVDGREQLFRVPLDASASPVELNPGSAGPVEEFDITPDGTRVVYMAGQDKFDRIEIYSVPITSPGATTRLNLEFAIASDVQDFLISPDSTRVVFRVDQYAHNVHELFTAPIDGSVRALRLNAPLETDSFVERIQEGYAIDANSRRVVFGVYSIVLEPFELYSAPIRGRRAPTRLNPPQAEGSDVFYFSLTPDGCRVTYVADQDDADNNELYSVPTVGGSPAKLHPPLVSFQDASVMVQVPGSRRVLFQADLEVPYIADLYSTPLPIQAGTITPADGPFAGGNTVMLRGCFTPATTVEFGGVAATSVTYLDAGRMRVVVPPQPAPALQRGSLRAERRGLVVDVTIRDGDEESTMAGGYRYGREGRRLEAR